MVVVAFDRVQLLDVTGPVEVLTTANGYGADYRLWLVSPGGADPRSSSGMRIGVDGPASALPPRVDTLIVPGRADWRTAVADPHLTGLVAGLAGRARRITSVCAGAFLLAAAGLLDGRRAVTHWQLTDELARWYPRVRVEPDPLFVRDGPVTTSAGVSAGIDLSLALTEDDYGPDVARATARFLVLHMARPGGQSQFSARVSAHPTRNATVRDAMDAVTADPAGPHDLGTLARRAGVSPRHLARLFRVETGLTPGRYVESVRVEAARALLESGEDPVDTVARRSGFGSAESMRRSFRDHLSVTPSAYRSGFRTTAPERS
ncbi:helix-turn-helix domain-containing protein [Streptomyces sp. HNM0574]|nr:helix-turn-helix domain-containing protein [Streptomyces sp. HNM0574]